MQSHEQRRAAGNSAPTDSNFKQTVLLLHGDGTNGAQNNTFVDSSTNNFTITRNGNTTQGSFSPFSQTGWSNYFDGSGDYLTLSGNPTLTTNFTIEFWFYVPSWGDRVFFSQGGSAANFNTSNGVAFQIYSTSTTFYVQWSDGAGSFGEINTATSGITTNAWHHFAVCNNGTRTRFWIDGTTTATSTTYPTWGYPTTRSTYIGYISYTSSYVGLGYISGLRVVTSDVYGATNTSITVPTAPLTAITNTSLLTCQSNRFIDNSSNAFTITRNGDTKVRPFSPFAPTVAYSTSGIGGSAYFDGSGDYLGIANDNVFDTNTTYTFEAWFYQPTAGDGFIFARGGGSASWSTTNGHQFQVFILTGTIYTQFNSSGSPISISTTSPPAGAWHHVAVGYNGTTTRMWLNGASVGTSTAAYTMPTTRNIIRIGYSASSEYIFTGYISNVRFVKGTDVYGVSNTSITVPTTPLTAITNTALLCNFTNAAIFDNTAKNDLETVGNAQISTSVVKYGTGSLYFDGTGDGLKLLQNDMLALGTGDWTIELWAYHASITGQQTYVGDTPGNSNGPYLYKDTSHKVGLYYSSQILTGTTTLSATTWYHIAVTRASGTVRLFVNGTQEASGSDTTDLNVSILWIGSDDTSNYLNGYIDDLRITKGVARYTSNFTAPTAAFANK